MSLTTEDLKNGFKLVMVFLIMIGMVIGFAGIKFENKDRVKSGLYTMASGWAGLIVYGIVTLAIKLNTKSN